MHPAAGGLGEPLCEGVIVLLILSVISPVWQA